MAADFTVTLSVDKNASDTFKAINTVSGWWISSVDGDSRKQGDHFSVRFKDIHYSKQEIVEMVKDRKVVWKVIDSKLTFLENESEWTGTSISFDIQEDGGKTQLTFTHYGLYPGVECYNDCSNAWGSYIHDSLKRFIETGKGKPFQP